MLSHVGIIAAVLSILLDKQADARVQGGCLLTES